MTNALAFTYVHSVTVQTRQGSGGYGDTFAAPAVRAAFVQEGNKVVINDQGAEQVSSSMVFAPLADAALYPPGSKVTLPSGRTTRVIQCARFASGDLNVGLDHIEVSLV